MNLRKLVHVALSTTILVGAPVALAKEDTTIGSVVDAMGQGIQKVLSNANEDLPDWLKRVEFEYRGRNESRPLYSVMTVQPLYQSKDMKHTFFTQLRAARVSKFNDIRTTLNGGLGYRHLVWDDKIMLGVNSFYDHEVNYHHGRMSVGAEMKWNGFDLSYNEYFSLTDDRYIADATFEQALSGRDVELTAQIPYIPWSRLRVKRYGWNSDQAAEEVRGWVGSAEIDLTQNLQVEAGLADDNFIDNEYFVQMRYRLGFGNDKSITTSRKIFDSKPFEMRDMKNHTLDKVRRTNDIVVEGVVSGAITISRGT